MEVLRRSLSLSATQNVVSILFHGTFLKCNILIPEGRGKSLSFHLLKSSSKRIRAGQPVVDMLFCNEVMDN